MKFIVAVIIIAVLGFAAELFFPWWSMTLVAALVAFAVKLRPGTGFLAGFAAIGLLWLTAGLWIDMANQHLLASRMAQVFHLSGAITFILVAAFAGALTGGFAAWSGALLRRYLH